MLEKGADINRKSEIYGDTPLHLAISQGSYQTIELLLRNGAGIDLTDNKGLSAISRSAFDEDVEATKLILSFGAKPDKGFYEKCIYNAGTKTEILGLHDIHTSCKVIIEALGEEKKSGFLNHSWGDEISLLNASTKAGHDCLVRFFVNSGADVNLLFDENSPLVCLLESKKINPNLVQFMVDKGAVLGFEREEQQEAYFESRLARLESSEDKENFKVIRNIITKEKRLEADLYNLVKTTDSSAESMKLLMEALKTCKKNNIFDLILRTKSPNGRNALHLAAENPEKLKHFKLIVAAMKTAMRGFIDCNSSDRVMFLLTINSVCSRLSRQGTEINGITALYLAVENKNPEAVKILANAHANPNMQITGGYTAMHNASNYSAQEIESDPNCLKIAEMFSNGHFAVPSELVKNQKGKSPLDLARTKGNEEMVKLLEVGFLSEPASGSISDRAASGLRDSVFAAKLSQKKVEAQTVD